MCIDCDCMNKNKEDIFYFIECRFDMSKKNILRNRPTREGISQHFHPP